jgi:hypothetical protein
MSARSDRENLILRHLREAGGGSLKPLMTPSGPLPRTTLYRFADALLSQGYVVSSEADNYAITDRGRERLDAAGALPASAAEPHLPISGLRLFPSPLHRAVGELAVLAAMARRSYERHHPSFVLIGSPLRGKTWTMRACCALLGADEKHAILHAGAETRGSIGARRNAKGEMTTKRAALEGPVLGIDEWLRGSKSVQEQTALLLHGERSIAFEGDEPLEVRSVVMLAMNPQSDGDLTARTGLDPAMIRRSFVVNLDRASLAESFADDGEERLEKIAAAGCPELPPSGDPDHGKRARTVVRRVLEETLDGPERLGLLDTHLIGQLVVAATGFLGFDDAVALVMRDALLCYETLDWTHSSWRERLVDALARLAQRSEARHSHREPVAPANDNPYDYTRKLGALAARCRKLGLEPDAAEERIRLVEEGRRGATDRETLGAATEARQAGGRRASRSSKSRERDSAGDACRGLHAQHHRALGACEGEPRASQARHRGDPRPRGARARTPRESGRACDSQRARERRSNGEGTCAQRCGGSSRRGPGALQDRLRLPRLREDGSRGGTATVLCRARGRARVARGRRGREEARDGVGSETRGR